MQISGKVNNQATYEKYQPEKKLFVSFKQAFLLAEILTLPYFPEEIG